MPEVWFLETDVRNGAEGNLAGDWMEVSSVIGGYVDSSSPRHCWHCGGTYLLAHGVHLRCRCRYRYRYNLAGGGQGVRSRNRRPNYA